MDSLLEAPTALRMRRPPSWAYDAIVACAWASCSLSSSVEVGTAFATAPAADETLSLTDEVTVAGLVAEAFASPRLFALAGFSSKVETGPVACC